MKICAIDIGTNSIKFSVYNAKLKLLRKSIDYVRIGDDIGKKKLSQIKQKKIIKSIKNFLLKQKHIDLLIAFATSAMRNFKNKNEIIKNIKKNTGINIKIISGNKEALYSFLSAYSLFKKKLKNKKVLYIDLGAGSTELIIARGKNIKYKKSIEIGALKLKKMPKSQQTQNKIKQIIKNNISRQGLKLMSNTKTIVGIGGSFATSAKILLNTSFYDISKISKSTFRVKDFQKLFEIVKNNSPEKLVRKYSIHKKRADLMLPGLLIIKSILELTTPKEIYISYEGADKGIIMEKLTKNIPSKFS